MWKYTVKRILWMIPVLLGISIVIFTIMYFCPGDRQLPFSGNVPHLRLLKQNVLKWVWTSLILSVYFLI